MRTRAGVICSWLLIGTFALLVSASSLLANRSNLLFGYVGVTILSGTLLFLIYRHCDLNWRLVLGVALLLRAAVFWLPPTLSDDAYRYVWDGRIQHAGYNPYDYRPSDPALGNLREGDLYERLNSRDFYSVYPPLSQVFFYSATWVSSNHWSTDYYRIKLILCLIEVVGVLALLRTSSPAAAVLYAWNPVVVMEVAGQAHTEGAAAGLLLLVIWLVRTKRFGGAAAAITGAGMVKLYPFLLLPLVWRRGRWIAVLASLASVALLVLPYARIDLIPHIAESLGLYVRYFEFNAGPYYAVKGLLELFSGQDLSKVIGPVFGAAFFVVLLGIYRADSRRRWNLERSLVAILAFFLLFSTTIHPWYLVPILAVLATQSPVRWHWYWLALLSTGTYFLYIDGPYWLFVVLGWGLWGVLAVRFHFDPLLQWVQRKRGATKFRWIGEWIPEGEALRILDLGAGEGYVGLEASRRRGVTVVLADVIDMNRTSLPFRRVDEDHLDFETGSFDYVILCYVLHHVSRQESVLLEAVRVSRRGVLIIESVYESELQHRVLVFLDRLANRVRSGGLMRAQEQYVHFRNRQEWLALIGDLGLTVERERSEGHWIHRKALILAHE